MTKRSDTCYIIGTTNNEKKWNKFLENDGLPDFKAKEKAATHVLDEQIQDCLRRSDFKLTDITYPTPEIWLFPWKMKSYMNVSSYGMESDLSAVHC